MSRNRRSLTGKALLASAVAATLLLAGCAKSDTPTGGSTTADPNEKVTLEMSWWGDANRATLFAQVIDKFQAKYPNITVKQTPVGSPDDLFNRLATDFGGGGSTAPDLFALGGAKPQEYGAAGALLDLDSVKDIVQVSKYPAFALTSAQVGGKLYGLPTGGNATAAFVNTDLFAKAGVPVPTASWTWDDLISAANKIGSAGLKTASGAPVYGIDLRVADIIGTYAAQQSQYGVYDPQGKVAVGPDVLAGWYQKELKLKAGGGLPDPSIVTANWALPPDQQPYTLGQAGITFGYSNLISTYSKGGTTVLLPPPTDSKKTGVALLPSGFWAINAQSKHPTQAAMLMNWFLNEPSAIELIKDSRGVPFNPDMTAVLTPLLQGPSKAAAEYVKTVLASGEVAPPQPNGGANMNKYTQDAEAEVLFGRQSPDQAAKTWVDKLTADVNAAK